jgi:hypothetical protein
MLEKKGRGIIVTSRRYAQMAKVRAKKCFSTVHEKI